MHRLVFVLILVCCLAGCGHRGSSFGNASLSEARSGFSTNLTRHDRANEGVDAPPPELFRLVKFPAKVGDLAAYVSVSPNDGKKHPAVIWVFGGFDNGIGDTAWKPASPGNDQSARAFREAGIVMMYPSLRGGNNNPGYKEGFFGEVDDVIAAADYLAQQDYVDPSRIYLGGHSTGGTLALLTAEYSSKFRAVFGLGPISDVGKYGFESLPFNVYDKRELELRAPINWLASIKTPTYLFEGTEEGNIDSLRHIASASTNPKLHCFEYPGMTHFSIIAAITPQIAQKVLSDTGSEAEFTFDSVRKLP